MKESFWFALTSFTPQGGGEAPKALSGRTLVAAYWLFVVLMLATFTANLAAFLTVERMQVITPETASFFQASPILIPESSSVFGAVGEAIQDKLYCCQRVGDSSVFH